MGILDGTRAVVTGAGTGIGRAIAIRFASEGASVALLGRRRAKLDETLAAMSGHSDERRHLAVSTDISEPEQVEAAAQRIREAWGAVDILVNNAAIGGSAHPIDSAWDDWVQPIRVNMLGAMHCCRAFVPLMPEGGRVVNVTSIHRDRVEKGASAYASAKGALTQYTKALALELADRGILVNAIAPGFVDTPMSVQEDGVSELETDWFRANYVDGHHLPLRRPGRPEEIAGVALFLAGPDATYVCGETITVDGGLTITF